MKTTKPKPGNPAAAAASRHLLKLCCAALIEKKAEDLRAFHVGPHSSITDYLVLATGGSEPHRRALRIELERIMKENRTRLVGVETAEESGWTVVDAFDVMVHIFSPEQRDRYRLENLWKDADEIDPAGLGSKPRPKPARARPRAPARRTQKP